MITSTKKKVLFLCIHNSARSQMAEALVSAMCGGQFEAHSAGLEPGRLNPLAVEVMLEIGIDISTHGTRSVQDVLRTGRQFDYVITVCDEAGAERCPLFPGGGTRLHWGFPDPSAFTGTWGEKLEQARCVRDAIEERVASWCRAEAPGNECRAPDRPTNARRPRR